MGWSSSVHHVHCFKPKQLQTRHPTFGIQIFRRMVLLVYCSELSLLRLQFLPHRQKRKRIRKIVYLQAHVDQNLPLRSYCMLRSNQLVLLHPVLPRDQASVWRVFSAGVTTSYNMLFHLLLVVFMLRLDHCRNAVEIHHCEHRLFPSFILDAFIWIPRLAAKLKPHPLRLIH